MPDLIWRGRIQNGQVYLDGDGAQRYQTLCESLEGKPVELILRRFRPKRSGGQNRYFHAVVIPIFAEFCGYTAEEMKEALKMKFLLAHHDGKPPTLRSTADLNTAEFTEFVEQCRQLAAELGCIIPSPGQAE